MKENYFLSLSISDILSFSFFWGTSLFSDPTFSFSISDLLFSAVASFSSSKINICSEINDEKIEKEVESEDKEIIQETGKEHISESDNVRK